MSAANQRPARLLVAKPLQANLYLALQNPASNSQFVVFTVFSRRETTVPVPQVSIILPQPLRLFIKFYLYSVYLAAILKYLATEILKLAGKAARDNKKHRIVPHHLQLAIRTSSLSSNIFKLPKTRWQSCL